MRLYAIVEPVDAPGTYRYTLLVPAFESGGVCSALEATNIPAGRIVGFTTTRPDSEDDLATPIQAPSLASL